jgi:xylulokinase
MPLSGLDVGSTGAKITVVDEGGRVLHAGYSDYSVSRQVHAHEVDANAIWGTVQALLRCAAAAVPDIAGVGVTSFGESFVLLDENDVVLMPTMMYTDPRGEAQADKLSEAIGAEQIADIAGTLPHPMFSLPKLMWVKQEKPDVFRRVKHVCLIGDFIVYMLTGQRIIDYSLASRTMGFDICKLEWSQRVFAAAGIDPALFGRPFPSGTVAGSVLPAVAQSLGLPENLHVVLSGQDQIAACIGSRAAQPGAAANGAGTVECVTPIFRGVPTDSALQKRNYSVIPFLDSGLYCCYAFSFAGGSLIEWFLRQMASGPAAEAAAKGTSAYREMEGGASDAPTGILVLPHFAGAATPYMDVGAKGAFLGLAFSHTTADMYRAVMEGIAYETMVNLEKLAEAGVKVETLNASGGCARSEMWLQMKADILGIPITRMSNDEAGTVGSIMLTGAAIGYFESLEAAGSKLAKPLHTYMPRPEMHRQYAGHYQRYRKVYDAIRPLL